MKPCPKCGSDEIGVSESVSDSDDPFFVWCSVCSFCGPESYDENEAIELWDKLPRSTQ